MNVSSVGLGGMDQSLFDSASANLGDTSSASSSSGSSAGASAGGGVGQDIAAAQYGFDGRVLAMQKNAASQLFNALA